ncbi:MAG: hypothetical protein JOZ86_15435 [Candidatus Eremiobacteraeota bacterium]|nr:hypothetical protein [Candidatus Eremiobacteraeota bacterium]
MDQASQTFWKYVLPAVQCEDTGNQNTCSYIDAIQDIELEPSFGFQIPADATSSANELLFRIDEIRSVVNQCQPFSYFASIPGGNAIPWMGTSVGGPADPIPGLGAPNVFSNTNHVTIGGSGIFRLPILPWQPPTTLAEIYDAVAQRRIGSEYSFTFSADEALSQSQVQWYPDFPGCDAADLLGEGQFGIAGVALVFEVFQRVAVAPK